MVTGFQYYTVSTDKYFATEYRRIKRKCGVIGCCVVDFIINEIYRVNGYYAEFTPDFVEDVAEYWGVSSEEVEDAVSCAVREGLFCPVQFEQNKILTSGNIQERFYKISATLKRKGVSVLPEFSCSIPTEINTASDDSEAIPEQFPNSSGDIPEQFPNSSRVVPHSNSISMGNSRDNFNSIDYLTTIDNLNNVVLCKNSESAAEGDTKQQGGIKKIDIEKYFFVERRMVQAERIAERFWNFNGTFDWQTSKGKVKNPMYAAKMWNPVPEEMGGHACTDKSLASKYFDFVKKVEATHPDGAKLLLYFNNISVEADGTTLTYNDSTAADILDTILINNQETAFKEFRAHFNAKTINYVIAE